MLNSTDLEPDGGGPETIAEVRSMGEQVGEYLRNEIYHGWLEPGVFINLKEIRHRLGMSKTPIDSEW